MKKILLFTAIIIGVYVAQAQNCNAVFFNQDGSRFQVVLNGVLQNINFETNVKVTDLKFEGSYKVTVIFENNQFASITKPIYMMDNNTEYSFEIKKNKKGEYVMRPSGMVAIAQAPAAPEQSVVSYSTTPPAAPAATTTTTVQPQAKTDVMVTETVTTTTTVDPANQENVSVGMNVGGVGMNVNVNVNDGGMNTGTNVQTTSSQTVTTTTVTSSSTSSGNYNDGMTTNPVHEPIPVEATPTGCYRAIPTSDFSAGKASVEKQSFADTKLKVAKTFTKNNCLSVAQVKEIMGLFSFEETKFEYAKFAYDFCADKKNYYQLSDDFTFSTTVDEFNEFLESK